MQPLRLPGVYGIGVLRDLARKRVQHVQPIVQRRECLVAADQTLLRRELAPTIDLGGPQRDWASHHHERDPSDTDPTRMLASSQPDHSSLIRARSASRFKSLA